MDSKRIVLSLKVAEKVSEFNETYKQNILWGSYPEGDVDEATLLMWLMDNIPLVNIALEIATIDAKHDRH